MSPLKVETLAVSVDSITIGDVHRDILQEKLTEFNKFLQQRKKELEEEFRTFAQKNGLVLQSKFACENPTEPIGPADLGQEIRHHQQHELDTLRNLFQGRLDHLFQKFQKEWAEDPREKKVVSFQPPCKGIDSKYLGEQLGDALGRGLAQVCEQRPKDPIEYLALWLRAYSENVKLQQQSAIHSLKVRLEEEDDMMIKEKQDRMSRERVQIKMEEERRRKSYLEQARKIVESKEEPQPEVTAEGDSDGKPEDKDGQTGGSTKRVTVVEPDNPNALYTIEEKDSVNDTADDEEEGN